jgi:galactokinase
MSVEIADRLIGAGMSPAEAHHKQLLFDSAERALPVAESSGISRWYVPGRIEVLGKHTDYAGGRSLLCAAERGICVVARVRDDSNVSICDTVGDRRVEFKFSPYVEIPLTGWTVYPLTVARRIARNFADGLHGADISLASDLPRSAGMSSSSALIVAIFMALCEINGLDQRPEYKSNIHRSEELAEYLGCIENGLSFGSLTGDKGVGTFGGSEDHTAILCCRPSALSQYSFCPVRAERTISFPAECTFVIACSGVKATKTGSARNQYNRVSRAAEAILVAWNSSSGEDNPTLHAAVASSVDAPARIRAALESSAIPEFTPRALLDRFDQFFLESEKIVPSAADALQRSDLRSFGELVDQSQQAAERWLGNQTPETIELVRAARSLGAHAASAFGAGFGGSVWALVLRSEAAQLRERWKESYRRLFPKADIAQQGQFFATAPGPALLKL